MLANVLRGSARKIKQREVVWRYLYNLRPTLAYYLAPKPTSPEAKRVLADLNADGLAMTSVQELLGPSACYRELDAAVESVKGDLAGPLNRARAAADRTAIG